MDIQTKKIIEELCVDLQAELDDRYTNRNNYPHLMQKYKAEMDVVRRAKGIIEERKVKSLNRYFVFYVKKIDNGELGIITVDTDDGKFPSISELANAVVETISITGFNEFKSEEDYLAFKGE